MRYAPPLVSHSFSVSFPLPTLTFGKRARYQLDLTVSNVRRLSRAAKVAVHAVEKRLDLRESSRPIIQACQSWLNRVDLAKRGGMFTIRNRTSSSRSATACMMSAR
jgi:hypothetical protein